MSLITESEKLRELEQKAQDAPDCPSPVEEVVYTDALLQHAPAMLEVLGYFKEGDEDLLVEYIYQFTEEYGVDGVVFSDTAFGKFMKRMQKAASLMEQEIIT